jgi:hypothetical protein
MADRFLTISEAEKFTGKSRSTLRRFIDGIVKADASPDRHLLTPTPEEVVALHAQNQPFAWKMSEELLRRQFLKPEEATVPDGEKGSGGAAESDSSRLVTVLEKSVAILERELAEKNTQIAAMNERLRESNILMKELQQYVALPSGKPSGTQPVEDRRPDAAAETPSAEESAKPKKRRFWWLFGA